MLHKPKKPSSEPTRFPIRYWGQGGDQVIYGLRSWPSRSEWLVPIFAGAECAKSDWEFLGDRGIKADDLVAEFSANTKRAILALLRDDNVPKSSGFHHLLADRLDKRLFFPLSESKKRRQKRQFADAVTQQEIKSIRDATGCKEGKARKKLAEELTHPPKRLAFLKLKNTSKSDPAEALRQRLKRARRERRR